MGDAGSRSKRYQQGMAVRRSVLGDPYVDRAEADKTPFDEPFQELVTEAAWGHLWTRDELTRRERSLVTLSILATLGHWEEFEMHLGATSRTGASSSDIREVLMHVAIYAGVPAANSAFKIAKRVLPDLQAPPT